ncbi:MAG: hypothetical protein EOO88_61890, partial [Pedobacter sp.]
LMLANLLGIRTILVYTLLGILVWFAFLQSGVHATIAGVLVAWTVPARNRISAEDFLARTRELLAHFEPHPETKAPMLTDEAQQHTVIQLEEACQDVQAPLQKMEHSLHFPVQFVVMPIFALANAGVVFSLSSNAIFAVTFSLAVMVEYCSVSVSTSNFRSVENFLRDWIADCTPATVTACS